jgi:hypothetical protein
MIVVAGKRIGPAFITGSGLAISALLCLALFAMAWGMAQ